MTAQARLRAVRKMIRHPLFDAVTAHEVGHTVGLRHNFSGSYDAWNYLPEYWAAPRRRQHEAALPRRDHADGDRRPHP
jgi:hypothetical protein